MVVTVNTEEVVKCIVCQAHGKSSIKGKQPVVLLGGHHGQTSKLLVGHIAEMHGKWSVVSDSEMHTPY